jgi:hypothetical protein
MYTASCRNDGKSINTVPGLIFYTMETWPKMVMYKYRLIIAAHLHQKEGRGESDL